MDKNKKECTAQGAENSVKTLADCRLAVKRDLTNAYYLIHSILEDENTLNTLADFLWGRLQNMQYRKELEKQEEIKFPE